MNHSVDQGQDFGKWGDKTSRFMYETSLDLILPQLNLQGHIGDFGGANGLLRSHSPDLHVTTIDSDASKCPDIVDNILSHDAPYDVAWCRYVLHYLTDQEVIQFIDRVNAPRVIVVQFTNEDLRVKYANSANETKHFRTFRQTEVLLGGGRFGPSVNLVTGYDYQVTPEFYKNRLGLEGATAHSEILAVFDIRK